jgi:capsular polysaccharide transport system permease protein
MRPGPILAEAGLLRALRTQARVIGALVMREMHTRFGRENLGYVWLFVEPMILAGSVALLQGFSGHGLPGGLSIFPYYIVSYTPYYLFRALLTRAASSFEANHSLFYHARVTLHDTMFARTVLETAAVIVALAVFLAGVGAFTGQWPHDPLVVALGIVLMGLLVHGMGLLVCASTVLGVHNVDRIVHPFTYLTIPISGAFFMVWWLPTEAQGWALMVPTVHIYEFIREGYFGPVVPYSYDLGYLLGVIAVLNAAGLLALRTARRHLEL